MERGPRNLCSLVVLGCDTRRVVFVHHQYLEAPVGKFGIELFEEGEFGAAAGTPRGGQRDERDGSFFSLVGGDGSVEELSPEVLDLGGRGLEIPLVACGK